MINSDPVSPFDVKVLVRIVVPQGLGVGGGKVSLLALRHFKKAVGPFSSIFHAKTLH
jgi:hypothetical protein